MAYTMTAGDVNVVSNLRGRHKEKIEQYPDEMIALAWRHFSQSTDYPDESKFVEFWLPYEE